MTAQPVNNKHRVSAYLYPQLYTKLALQNESHTEVITRALELYFDKLEEKDKNYNATEREQNLQDDNQKVFELYEARIGDLQTLTQEQIKIHQAQLKEKDEQIKAQAIHIQTLLNQKQIEAPGAKKPWWQFW